MGTPLKSNPRLHVMVKLELQIGNINLQNFSEDLDDLDICVRPHFNTPAFAASIVKSQIERGSMRTFIVSKLEQYVQDIKSEYGGQNAEACSTGNIVKSK